MIELREADRELLERALDELWSACEPTPKAARLYCHAIAVVRERPAGARRLRADHNTVRPTPLFGPEVP